MPDGSYLAEPSAPAKTANASNNEAAPAPSSLSFDDSGWRSLNLPHDWAIEGPFRMELPSETGKLPWVGIGWYRKSFELPAADMGKSIFLDFDGAMSHAKVFVNGKQAGEWAYGFNRRHPLRQLRRHQHRRRSP